MGALLSDLGSGVILAWIALPLLAATVTRDARVDAASRYRAVALVLALATAVIALPFVRTAADAGASVVMPSAVEYALFAARAPVASSRFGGASALGLVGALWAAVAGVAAARAVVCTASLAGIVRRAREASPQLQARLAALAAEVGVATPRLRVSDEQAIPFTTGALAPVIVVPGALLEAFEARAVDLVLLHELSHVARRDTLTSALLAVPRAVFALHPTARALFAELQLARELAVDEAVAAIDPVAYPRVLVDVACHARFGSRLYAAVGMHRTDLAQRLDALADRLPRRRATPAVTMVVATLLFGSAMLAPQPGSATGGHGDSCPQAHAACPRAAAAAAGAHGPCPGRAMR